jgi:hypothetical protein
VASGACHTPREGKPNQERTKNAHQRGSKNSKGRDCPSIKPAHKFKVYKSLRRTPFVFMQTNF